MEVIITIALIWLVLWLIWQLIKAIIWFTPYIFKFMLIILGLGCLIGLPIGIYFGIKCYLSSINKNITSPALKTVMIIITIISIVLLFAYSIAIIYYMIRLNQ